MPALRRNAIIASANWARALAGLVICAIIYEIQSKDIFMPTLEWIGKDKVISHHLDVPYVLLESNKPMCPDRETWRALKA